MDSTDNHRRIARMDYAFCALNAGSLPVFRGDIENGPEGIVLTPCDASPETALAILDRYAINAGYPNGRRRVTLDTATAGALIRAVPGFYQNQTEWTLDPVQR